MRLELSHEATRLNGFTDLELTTATVGEQALNLRATKAGEGLLVLNTRRPLQLVQAEGISAELVPGWSGWLGIARYGLRLKAAQAGAGRVRIKILRPNDKLATLSPDQI